MAGIAVRIRQLVIIIHMTLCAGQCRVRPGQGKLCQLVREPASPLHGRDLMAARAIGGKAGRCVGRRRCGRVGVSMASVAVRRRPGILFSSRVDMTFLAGQHAVPPQQGKPGRLVLLDHVRDVPGLQCVASKAVRAHFALVDIRVARNATR